MSQQKQFDGNPAKQMPAIFLSIPDNEELRIVSREKGHSPIRSEESKCIETIDYNWQYHSLGGEVRYLEKFVTQHPNLDAQNIERLDLQNCFDTQSKPAFRKTTQGLMQNMALKIQSRICMAGEDKFHQDLEHSQADINAYRSLKGGPLGDQKQKYECSQKEQPEFQQKNNIIMTIIKTALVLIILVLGVHTASQQAGGSPGKAYNCANIDMVQLIGGDPIQFDQSQERYIAFPGNVRFSHKTHKQTMDALKDGKDYFGTNSIHYSSSQNGIYIFIVEKSQENIIQSYIKTSLPRTYKEVQIPQVYYLKTAIKGDQKYAIHQITLSDKKEMKRELFKEEKETMESFTGLQFSKRFVNIVFATLETGGASDFTADEAFLKGMKGIIDDIGGGKKCGEFFCPPPSNEKLAEQLSDIPVLKIQCANKQCTYSKGGEKKVLFAKIPFLQVGNAFRYLDKPINGMLLATVAPNKAKFASITAQLNLKCSIKDFDFHLNGYSGAFQSVHLGDQKLYSALIIEPGYNGIKRKLRTQTPELYDLLEGIEKVKQVYYFMIITSKGPEELFKEVLGAIEKAKTGDQKKYQCTLRPKEAAETSFVQLSSNLQGVKKGMKDTTDDNEEYEYEYVYEYDYDFGGEGEGEDYEYVYEYDFEEMPQMEEEEQEQQEEHHEEIHQTEETMNQEDDTDQVEFDQSTEYSDSEETPNSPQADLLEIDQNEMCFQAYADCHYRGVQLKICGPNPNIPSQLENFLIKSIKMPEQMRITFYTIEEQKIVLEGNQECLSRPFEIDQLRPQR